MDILKSYFRDIKNTSRNAKLFMIANAFYGILLGATWMSISVIIEDAYSPVVLGAVIVMHSLGMTVSSLPAGMAVNKYGYKAVLVVGTVLGAVCLVLNGILGSLLNLLFINFMFGLSQGIYEVMPAPFISANAESKERPTTMAIMFAVYWLAVVIVTKTSGPIVEMVQNSLGVTEMIAYQYFTNIAALIGLLGVFPILAMEESVLDRGKTIDVSSVIDDIKVLLNKNILSYLAYMGFIGLGAGLFCPFFSNFFKDGFNLDISVVSDILALQYFAMVIGMILCPLIVKKFGQVVTLGAMSLASVPFMLLIVNSDQFGSSMVTVLFTAFFMRTGLMNLAMPVMYAFPLQFVTKEKRAPLAGMMALFSSGTRSISSIIAGILMSTPAFTVGRFLFDGYRIPYYIAGILYTIASIYLIRTFSKNKKENRRVEESRAYQTEISI